MPLPARRSIVIISGLLTLLVLTGGTLAMALHNGWLRTAAVDVRGREPLTASTHATPTGNDPDSAARLNEPPPAPLTQNAIQDGDDRFTEHDGDDDRRGRRSDRRRSHDD